MKSLSAVVTLLLLVVALGVAQESDYKMQKDFEKRSEAIKARIDAASTTGELDSLRSVIDALGLDFQKNKAFLDKALYPSSFDGSIDEMRQALHVAYDRTTTIQTQGFRIAQLESTVVVLGVRIDTLSGERTRLFSDLQEANKNVTNLRETVRRLNANLQANDRLVFSLIDSIFLPYDRDMKQTSDIEKEHLAGNLQRANVLSRVYDVASDNVRFLTATQLQPKDYASLVEQQQQFHSRWTGLSDKMRDVAAAAERQAAKTPEPKRGEPQSNARLMAATASLRSQQVDSVLNLWHATLASGLWASLEKEFTSKQVPIEHFTDGPSFSAAVKSLVARYKEAGADPTIFVDQVWKERIDKEWRDALTKESVLGKAEYASLDRTVSELHQKQFSLKLVLYILGIVLVALVAWWLISRRQKQMSEMDQE
jgi:hypothetical protein